MIKKAVLVIHGFGADIYENKYIVEYLKKDKHYDIYDFTLPGHEKAVIEKVKYQDWIDESKKQLENLINNYKSVYLIGHSMGGVIASYLASQYREVKKLVLLAPAFKYLNFTQNREDIKKIYTLKQKKYKIEYREELYHEIISKMRRLPLFTIIEFVKLVNKYKKYAKGVKCPTLIIHGDEDELVPVSSSKYIFGEIGTKRKYFTLVKEVKHRMLLSKKQDIISKYIRDFLKGGLLWIIKKKSNL